MEENKFDIKEMLFGLFRSRKFRAIVIGFLVSLAAQKGWLGDLDEGAIAKLNETLTWAVGLFVGATALEDAAAKANLITIKDTPAEEPVATPPAEVGKGT